MEDKREDRRARKTRAALEKAYIELILKKDISKITILDVTEKADVARGTFYIHFCDIYELADYVEERLLSNLTRSIEFDNTGDFSEEAFMLKLETAIDYMLDNKRIFKRLICGAGSGSFVEKLRRLLEGILFTNATHTKGEAMSEEKLYDLHIIINYYISGIIGAAQFCLENDRGYSASQIAHTLGHRIISDYVSISRNEL